MKKSLLLLALIIHFIGYSQTLRKNFYVVEKTNTTIAPATLTANNDGRLTLTFIQNSLQSFFSDKDVYKYEKPFVGTNSSLLKRTYLVSISDEPNILSQLKNLTDVDFKN